MDNDDDLYGQRMAIMDFRGGSRSGSNVPKPRHLLLLKSALERRTHYLAKSQGYIQVFLDGGLNQQRIRICDAVVVAKILNATLVFPHLEADPI
ncbi:hypothetical protein F0562_003154 [Nyssa sinensis]|uniref:O-fucosyltransferase family protein n=1 Tax=Nyssa sinensis TaxID=561372 RepID=A0A5J5BUN6_9ASTE|nr:hypothetical protein F0562_003154 [Nyssa sinensis]